MLNADIVTVGFDSYALVWKRKARRLPCSIQSKHYERQHSSNIIFVKLTDIDMFTIKRL